MPKILIADTYYPDFLKSWQFNESADYETELNRLLDFEFGTGRAYSRNLGNLGWEVIDVVANYEELQYGWYFNEHGGRLSGLHLQDVALLQIEAFAPDVVFLQDVSFFDHVTLGELAKKYVLAAQISCPMPPYENIRHLYCIFTSFPHYLKRFEEAGIKAIYNPLGFEHRILERVCGGHPMVQPQRIHDVVFIGGVGNPSHWKRGMETLHAVAEAIPTFKWWGYGQDTLPDGPLKQKYQGSAFGLDMYRILLQSKFVVSRHGEVAEGYANAMRIFESSGCGALLVTENAKNLDSFFSEDEVADYDSPADAVDVIYTALMQWDESSRWQDIAKRGQARTLRDHTYQSRMRTVSDTLMGML